MLNTRRFITIFTFIFLFGASQAFAQSSAFVYQGKLTDGASAASGSYQFEFKLFDAASGGNQIGQTLSGVSATVTNGIFSVNLDFGVASYTGAARYLEIGVRLSGSGQAYTTLNPRQAVTSTPYAVRSLNANQADTADTANTANTANNAANLGGIAANQYVLTTDPRLNQIQSPGNFIQNSTNQQPTSNFNISGEGKADKFTAATQFNIGATRVLTAGNGNLFAGFGAGQGGAVGGLNTFVGNNAGMNTTNGTRNSFAGAGAGLQNTLGNDNSYFGSGAGLTNQTGDNNSFFGANSGNLNTADNNSFFGANSGKVTSTGTNNAFFGSDSGKANTTGAGNSFFGRNTGSANLTGNYNSFFGNASGQNNTGTGNSFYGDSSGLLNSSGGNNSFFGKAAGLVSTTGSNNVFLGYSTGINNSTGSNNTLLGANAQVASGNLQFATAIGAGSKVTVSNLIVLGREDGQDNVWMWGKTYAMGGLTLGAMVPGASFALCGGGSSGTEIGFCSSSIRYKENVTDFTRGLDLITKLRPVTFDWKQNGERDLGFIAEEVSEVEPLLNVRIKGRIEGVKYAQITTALVNSVKEQQAQIEQQRDENQRLQEQVKTLQAQMDALKALVCAANPAAAVCQQK